MEPLLAVLGGRPVLVRGLLLGRARHHDAVYLSWLVVPIKSIPHHPSDMRWIVAGVVLAIGVFFLLRGPNIARVAVVGVGLALLPYVPVEIWTASRYSYSAVAFFSPLVAIAG